MSKQKDYIKNIEGAERRFITETVAFRAAKDNSESLIEGHALKFNKVTTIGDWFREEILPGALDEVLQDDVRALFNHDPNFVLARSKDGKGTLKLEVDAEGLRYSYVTPNTTYAKDLEENIRLGNVSQSSFGFTIDEQRWVEREGELPLRQIVKLKRLYDVSPVTYPAYQDTSVAKRSHDAFAAEKLEVNDAQNVRKDNNNQKPSTGNEQKQLTVRNAQCIIYNY